MKLVPLQNHGDVNAKEILTMVLGTAPTGHSIADMRPKLVVLDKVEAATGDSVLLEDAEHQLLVSLLESRSNFAITSRGLVALADAVKNAKAPPQK